MVLPFVMRMLMRVAVSVLGLVASATSALAQDVAAAPPPLVLRPIAELGPGAKREISGIVRGLREHEGAPVFWTQNDSGDEPRIYAVRADGTLIRSVREADVPGTLIAGAINGDWEDIALLRRTDGTSQVVVADFGNNSNARADLTIYFIEEPEPTESRTSFTSKVMFRYPDQSRRPAPRDDFNFDAEALFTVGEEVYILSKNRSDEFTKLYRLDDRTAGVVNTATYADRFDDHLGTMGQVTGADCSADGLTLAVLTYTHVWIFERRSRDESFFSGRVRRVAYQLEGTKAGEESDSEAICFEKEDGEDSTLLIADESRALLYRVRLKDVPQVLGARMLLSPSDADAAKDVRVVSFNIRYGTADDGANSWDLRRERVGAAMLGWDADIIGMQEVVAAQADWVRELLPTHTFHGVGRTDGARQGEFAPILFRTQRFELEAAGHFWLSPTPEVVGSKGWDAALERMASWVRLVDRATRRRVLVINTHFDHRGAEARAQSLALVRARASEMAKGAAVIITGDFNTSADAAPGSTLFGAADGGVALYDTFRRVYPTRDVDEATFSGWNTPPAKALTIAGERIDWIVASEAFETISAEIDRRTPGGRLISDHYPVRARLRFVGRGE